MSDTWRTPPLVKYNKRTDSYYAFYEDVNKESGAIVHSHMELWTVPRLDLENRGKNWNERA